MILNMAPWLAPSLKALLEAVNSRDTLGRVSLGGSASIGFVFTILSNGGCVESWNRSGWVSAVWLGP